MREDCKHYQSRTYASGEVARICVLDLAPEAPWRCPDNCPRYERRLADAGWVHGSLVEPAIEDEPNEAPGDIAALLDSAEDIVNAVVPEALDEIQSQNSSFWQRYRKKMSDRRRGGSDRPQSGDS